MTGAAGADWSSPRYGSASLAEVLPSAAALLGVPGHRDRLGLAGVVRDPRAVVVVLVDGLGAALLEARRGHAPYLRDLAEHHPPGVPSRLTSAFPSTTASSLATLGTGLPPGRHGLVGYDVLDPERDRVVNQLTWPDDLDPQAWQPRPTVFEAAVAAGVAVVRVGPKEFDGSGLTAAALRGGRYAAAESLGARVDATARALRSSERCLAYLYWGQLDRTGHGQGWESLDWTRQLEDLDGQLARLSAACPPGTLVVVTADHGMVDVPAANRVDAASRPDLLAGVRRAGGEPRAVYLWPEPGRSAEVADRWRHGLGDAVEVLTRADAASRGWFGPAPDPAALDRAGELVVLARGRIVVVDSRRHRRDVLTLVGWHGSLTADEVEVPLLVDLR
ncbi:MAG: alkaline phosphatase family protein [Kineosporiaceae bacterium]